MVPLLRSDARTPEKPDGITTNTRLSINRRDSLASQGLCHCFGSGDNLMNST
jgi:hypothetical protein